MSTPGRHTGAGFPRTSGPTMKRGEAVSWLLIQAVAERLGRSASDIATPSDPPGKDADERINAWTGSWADVIRLYMRKVEPPSLAMCQNEGDLRDFSEMSIEHTGRNVTGKPDLKIRRDDAINIGGDYMGQSPEQFCAWLTPLWMKNPMTALFRLCDRGAPAASGSGIPASSACRTNSPRRSLRGRGNTTTSPPATFGTARGSRSSPSPERSTTGSFARAIAWVNPQQRRQYGEREKTQGANAADRTARSRNTSSRVNPRTHRRAPVETHAAREESRRHGDQKDGATKE